MRLYERGGELSRLQELIAGARQGVGGLAIVEGPPGIGKSALLEEAARRARAAGLWVLSARGCEVEREFSFGAVRQLLEPAIAGLKPADRGTVLAGAARIANWLDPDVGGDAGRLGSEPFAMLHGLYWALVNLSVLRPLLVSVDDAHWLDERSLLWLGFVARRIEDLPVLLVLAARSTSPEAPRPAVEAIKHAAAAQLIVPRALGEPGVRSVVEDGLHAQAEPEFTRSCAAATGGNPFLLWELVRSLAAEGVTPTRANAARVHAVRPDTVARGVVARLAVLGPAATAVARAVVVLGEGAALHHIAALAEVELSGAAAAIDELAAADLFARALPARFRHPLIRAALEGELAAGARAVLHRRAAQMLEREGGADPERVATHLLRAAPSAEGWVVRALRAAGAVARARGAPEAAVEYLGRALVEPPTCEQRPVIEGELGMAAAQAGFPTAVAHLEAARAALADPDQRVTVTRALAGLLFQTGRAHGAVRVLESELGRGYRGEARVQLQAELQALRELGGANDGQSSWGPVAADGDSPAGRCLLATVAMHQVRTVAAPARTAAQTALRALASGALVREQGPASLFCSQAISALYFAGWFDDADREIVAALQSARASGSSFAAGQTEWLAACVALQRGRVRAAEMHARSSLELAIRLQEALIAPATSAALLTGMFPTFAVLVEALLELGRSADALAELERFDLARGAVAETPLSAFLLAARARLALEQADPAQARADALDAGTRAQSWGAVNPAMVPWRRVAALACHQLGEQREALELAEADLELAERFGAPRPLGVALRTRGLVRGREGVDDLRCAVEALEASGAEVEHARSLVELGAALRRAGTRGRAREPLRRAAEIASRCGADLLVNRALSELRATGARPRRLMLSGVESLTAREREVAQLAARGLPNPQIAQALFVTRGTVEKHLESVYRKLSISSREQLPTALAQ